MPLGALDEAGDLAAEAADATVYSLDPESDIPSHRHRTARARVPLGAAVRVTYEYGGGPQGVVPSAGSPSSTRLPHGEGAQPTADVGWSGRGDHR